MPVVRLAKSIVRHVGVEEAPASGSTVRAVLEDYFGRFPDVRGYVLDDQNVARHHVSVFVDGMLVSDRRGLSDAVTDRSIVEIFQALSGG